MNLNYPLYVIESKAEFSFYSESEIKVELTKLLKCQQKDDEHIYDNIYLVKNDYQPKIPGKDYMGIIPHRHVDNDVLKEFERGEVAES